MYYDKSPCPARPNKRHVANKLLLDEDLTFKVALSRVTTRLLRRVSRATYVCVRGGVQLRLPSDVATRLGKQLRIDVRDRSRSRVEHG